MPVSVSLLTCYCCCYASVGGFSGYAGMPSYQSSFVHSYLSTECTAANGCTLPPSSYYNSANRGFPRRSDNSS